MNKSHWCVCVCLLQQTLAKIKVRVFPHNIHTSCSCTREAYIYIREMCGTPATNDSHKTYLMFGI